MGNESTRRSPVANQPVDDQRRAVVKVDLQVESEGMELMDGLGRRLDKSRVAERPGSGAGSCILNCGVANCSSWLGDRRVGAAPGSLPELRPMATLRKCDRVSQDETEKTFRL